jgi:hypothetical protein
MGYIKGDSKIAKTSRLRLNQKFLSDLEKHYNEVGHTAIEMVFRERPVEYLKFIANLLPKEIDLTVDNQLADITDAELDELVAQVRERRGRRLAITETERREDQALN